MKDELPNGWTTAPLDSICEKIRGVSYKREEASTVQRRGYLPILRANNIDSDRLSFTDLVWVPSSRVGAHQRIRSGDVVVAVSSGSKSVVGKTAQALTDWDGAFGAFCGVLRPILPLNSRYFGLFLCTREYRNHISDLAAGSNINNLKNEHFAAIEVPLAPLSEQERIVVKLERLLAKVGQCHLRVEKIFKFLKRFRQSVLSAACSGRLTADWREEHIGECLVSSKQASSRSNSQIEEIVDTPDEWTWVTLDFLCNPNRSICYGVIKLGIEHDQGVPCLRTSDVKPLRIDTVGVKRIDPLISNQFGRTVLRGGEVLVNVRGTLGGVAVVPPELNGWNISREVAVVPVVDADHEFIAFWIASLSAQGWLTSVVKGVAYSGINIEDLRQLPVALPSLTEQEEIVRRVKNLLALADKIEGRYMTVQRQVDSLPQSILAKAFRGELVPTEAELAEREGRPYESAEQLLRRIRVSTEGFNHSISRKDSRRRDNVAR